MAACSVYLIDVERVQMLFNHGANVNAQGTEQRSWLPAKRARTNAAPVRGFLLQIAIISCHKAQCLWRSLLLHHKADVNARGANYGTALSAACSWGHSSWCNCCLNTGQIFISRIVLPGIRLYATQRLIVMPIKHFCLS